MSKLEKVFPGSDGFRQMVSKLNLTIEQVNSLMDLIESKSDASKGRQVCYYSTNVDMIADESLELGDLCISFGSAELGDESVKVYKITGSIVDIDPDLVKCVLLSNGLWAVNFASFSGDGSGTGGGGGGDSSTTLEVEATTPLSLAVAEGGESLIGWMYTTTVGNTGSVKIYVDDGLKYSGTISAGENSFDVTQYMTPGTHTVEVLVTNKLNASKSLTYIISVVALTLSSTFNDSTVFSEDIQFNYTPVGAVEKQIHFILDGTEIYCPTISASGKQQTQGLEASKFSHGSHVLRVYATALVGNTTLKSNELIYSIMFAVPGNSTPIIASAFDITEVTQGTMLAIDYFVYTPDVLVSSVALQVNDTTVSSLSVGRTKQRWTISDYPLGNVTFSIKSGSASKTFTVYVTQPEIVIEAEKNGLDLYLTSTGRSNSETDRDTWIYKDIQAELTKFNYGSNGWVTNDNGETVLRLSGDARVNIPFNLFSVDPRSNGMTIEFEFETRNVSDFEAPLISCMNNNIGIQITAQQAVISSEQLSGTSAIRAQFKENEKIRVSFVIQSRAENRLVYTYLNGIMSGVAQYKDNDNFVQKNPVGITIGSNYAGIDVFNIRKYRQALTKEQILTNYMADITNVSEKIECYNRNDIFDDYSKISYTKVSQKMPCLTIIGALPTYKGDKKKVRLVYEHNTDASKNFDYSGCSFDVQGTSSQYFPRKNYKGKLPSIYKLFDDSVPEKTFCYKADYMDSSHRHNTVTANVVNSLYRAIGLLPPQTEDNNIQMAVRGYICAVFQRDDENSERVCLGAYNFNNDKSDVDTFGYTEEYPKAESWEFCNNTSDRCLFKEFWSPYYKLTDGSYVKVSNYDSSSTSKVDDTQYYKLNTESGDSFVTVEEYNANPTAYEIDVAVDFEARYPEDFYDYTNLSRVISWVASTADDINKFKSEFEQYFSKPHVLAYFVIGVTFGMVDSFAKNLFLSTWDGKIWYPVFYDMDTCFGLNNEGVNTFSYDVEFNDTIGTQRVFNGSTSILWNNVQKAFESELNDMFASLVNYGMNYASLVNIHESHTEIISEAMFNEDADFKYIQPLLQDSIETYLYITQGSRLPHFKWWLKNRFNYLNSKYNTSDYVSDYATMRLYTPLNSNGEVDNSLPVRPSANFDITAYISEYVRIKFGSIMTGTRVQKGNTERITAPDIKFNDTETIIYGASNISDLGDLSGKYAGTIDLSKAVKLTKVIAGSGATNYKNTNLTNLSVGNNKLLEIVDVRNCPNLVGTLDLSGCDNIQEIYAQGTSLTAVALPAGGSLKKMYLPATIANLTIRNQDSLATLSLAGYTNLATLRVENSKTVDISTILKNATNLARVRLLDVDIVADNWDVLERLGEMQGISEDDTTISTPIVTGTYYSKASSSAQLTAMREKYATIFPDLQIDAAHPVYWTANFINYDGTILDSQTIEHSLDAVDPITRSERPIDTPTRPADDACYSYVYNGWDGSLTNFTGNRNILARYTQNRRSNLVSLYNGDTKLYEISVLYNEGVNFDTSQLTYPGTEEGNWVFWKWDKDISHVITATEAHAIWIKNDPDGLTLSDGTLLPKTAFGDCTWAQIKEVCDAGLASFWWNIGDTKKITLFTGEILTLQIYDFDHDYKDANNWETLPITIGMKNLMKSTHRMNPTHDNEGGWPGCEMYTYLNTEIWNYLPADLKAVITPTVKKTNRGHFNQTIEVSTDNLFLFNNVEVGWGSNTSTPYCYEGHKYPIFSNNSSRIKYLSDGAGLASTWWLRCPNIGNTTNFWFVYGDGYVSSYGYAGNSYGVCFGFCI